MLLVIIKMVFALLRPGWLIQVIREEPFLRKMIHKLQS